MVTDVLLLNTFNSLGLPTSTTVSIIFELLGGAIAMACLKVWQSGAPFTDLGTYLNSGKALAMILAILTSVLVAFISGVVVQWVLRLVFTFRYERIYRWLGGVFAGVAFTAIFYFLVMKGAKGASFMRPEWIEWIDVNTEAILIASFLGCSIFFQALILFFRLNVFPYVILAGTFALAFAFAGNDLVNFIGVPMAALDSWNIFSAAEGANPDTFLMGGLRDVTHTPTYILLGAGLVMVLTLCFSKKAHTVIRTSINLSSSSRGGKEQFGSSLPARMLVRGALHANDIIHQIIPKSIFRVLDKRFEQPKHSARDIAFDEVREREPRSRRGPHRFGHETQASALDHLRHLHGRHGFEPCRRRLGPRIGRLPHFGRPHRHFGLVHHGLYGGERLRHRDLPLRVARRGSHHPRHGDFARAHHQVELLLEGRRRRRPS